MSLESNAICRGIRTYDTSLPQPWVDAVGARIGLNPYSHVVWCYDDMNAQDARGNLNNLMGYPRAVDAIGDEILGRLAASVR